MGLVILALLAAASGGVAVLRRIQPEIDYSELSARVLSWRLMAGIFLTVLAPGHKTALVFFAFLSFWGLKEYLTLLKTRPADHRSLALCFLVLPAQYYLIAIGWRRMFIPVYPVNHGRRLPKGEWFLVSFYCEIRIGPPQVFSGGNRREILERLRSAILSLKNADN